MKSRVDAVIAAMPNVAEERYYVEEWARKIDYLEAEGNREIEKLIAIAPNALKEYSAMGAFFDGHTKRIQAIREEIRIREEALAQWLKFAGALKAYVEARKDD
jgi:hypothetical protein